MTATTEITAQKQRIVLFTASLFIIAELCIPTYTNAYSYQYNNGLQNNWVTQQHQYYANYDWTDIPMRQPVVQNIRHTYSNNYQHNYNNWHNSNSGYLYDNQYQAYFYTVGEYQPQPESRFYQSMYDQYYTNNYQYYFR